VLGTSSRPRVGLLSVDSAARGGDAPRREAIALLDALGADGGAPLTFVGAVGADAVAVGGRVEVVVTDGFTGALLLDGLAAMLTAVRQLLERRDLPTSDLDAVTAAWDVDGRGGQMLLGVDGTVVICAGTAGESGVAAAVAAAASACRARLVPRLRAEMEGLVARRRAAAGLPRREAGSA
jgi:glycerol-3-phosphate acyltransferase PlsX